MPGKMYPLVQYRYTVTGATNCFLTGFEAQSEFTPGTVGLAWNHEDQADSDPAGIKSCATALCTQPSHLVL